MGAQAVGVNHHLILLHHAANTGDFRHAGDGLQFELEKPVLNSTQLGQVMAPAAIHQGIGVHPAHPGGVRPELRLRPLR